MADGKDKILSGAGDKMRKAVSVNLEELKRDSIRPRARALLNRVTVDYYGTRVPLHQISNLSVPEPRVLMIVPYDPGSVAAVEKAILASDIGITPNNDGTNIRLVFPQLTEERRKELIKVAHSRAEEGRVAIRSIRRHSKQDLEQLRKEGTLPEDEERAAEGRLQRLTDKHVAEVDENLKRKEQELSEV